MVRSGQNSERSCRQDVRGAAFESIYVHLVMQACSSEHAAAPLEVGPRSTADSASAVGETQWNCLDNIQLEEIFQMRFRVAELSRSLEGEAQRCTHNCVGSSPRSL